MWKYQQTNDMFIKHSDPELYHSDTYLGKDFSDGIKHWKYIKRERKNGRWVYYYKDDKLNKLEKDYLKARSKWESYEHPININGFKTTYYKRSEDKARKKAEKKMDSIGSEYSYNKLISTRREKKYKPIIKTLNFSSKTIAKGKKFFKSLFK